MKTFYCSRHVWVKGTHTRPTPRLRETFLVWSMLSKMLGTPALEDQKVNAILYTACVINKLRLPDNKMCTLPLTLACVLYRNKGKKVLNMCPHYTRKA